MDLVGLYKHCRLYNLEFQSVLIFKISGKISTWLHHRSDIQFKIEIYSFKIQNIIYSVTKVLQKNLISYFDETSC